MKNISLFVLALALSVLSVFPQQMFGQNRTRVYPQETAWMSLTDTTTTSSSNVCVDTNGFSFMMAPGDQWEVEFSMIDSGIVSFGILVPTGASIVGQEVFPQTKITQSDGQTSALTNKPDLIYATIKNGTIAGACVLRFSTSSTATVRAGSVMFARRIKSK